MTFFVGMSRRVRISWGINLLVRLTQEYFDLIHERLSFNKSVD